MKTFSNFINERFINWWTDDEYSDMMEQYTDRLKYLIDFSYRDIGGYMNGTYNFQKDIVDDCTLIKMAKKGGEIVAFRVYKDKLGRKAVCSGCDGTPAGKDALYSIFKEDTKFIRSWSEVNSKLEHIFCTKYGAERVPVNLIPDLLGQSKAIKPLPDGFHYKREISGVEHTKCVITGSTKDLINKINNIPKDYD